MHADTKKYNKALGPADRASRDVQWDYKGLVKRKGNLERLKVASRG